MPPVHLPPVDQDHPWEVEIGRRESLVLSHSLGSIKTRVCLARTDIRWLLPVSLEMYFTRAAVCWCSHLHKFQQHNVTLYLLSSITHHPMQSQLLCAVMQPTQWIPNNVSSALTLAFHNFTQAARQRNGTVVIWIGSVFSNTQPTVSSWSGSVLFSYNNISNMPAVNLCHILVASVVVKTSKASDSARQMHSDTDTDKSSLLHSTLWLLVGYWRVSKPAWQVASNTLNYTLKVCIENMFKK